jgi:hypothetical protein
MPSYTITGRAVYANGAPIDDKEIKVYERVSLTSDVCKATTRTSATGTYVASWVEASPPATPWDVFVRVTVDSESVESALISDLTTSPVQVDLVFGDEAYRGLSEWERVSAAIAPLLGAVEVEDISAGQLEWLARRSNVYPLHLALYIQAHRLAANRTIEASSCYAFLRAGMPTNMPGLLRESERAWEAALRNAWVRQLIPLPGAGAPAERDAAVEQEIEAMRELLVEAAVAETNGSLNPRSFFDEADIAPADQAEFMQLWFDRDGTLSDFWQAVGESTRLVDKIDDFRFAIQGAALTGYHPETLAALVDERDVEAIETIADTAAWGFGHWESLLIAHSVTPPDRIPGADAAERRANYARMLERASEDAYPTRSLRHRIAAAEAQAHAPPHTDHLVDFFDDNLDFDLLTTNIDHWVAEHPSAFAGTSDAAEARENLEIVQRVYRLSPRLGRYETTRVLLVHDIRSAADVADYARDEFVHELGQYFSDEHHDPEALAGRIWDRSVHIHSSAQAMISTLAFAGSGADAVPLSGIDDWGFGAAENGLAGLDAILGGLDYCACKLCRSVFGAAAYLADLLHFLDKRPTPFGDALTALRIRRPDLEHILLDCANTNTVLPYIDLVNELLERLFADDLDGSSYATTWTADELRLHPEHQLAAVYDGTVAGLDKQLTELVHPWTLPFFLPELEARQMLDHLGVPRHRLMALLVDDDGDPVEPSADDIVAEALGMSAVEHAIIAGTYDGNTSTDGREFWGLPAGSEFDFWVLAISGFHEEHGSIRHLLGGGDYTIAQLEELLSLTYVDPNHYVGSAITINWDETCDLDDATISNLDEVALDRLHRFTRLARRTKIPVRMLNVLIEEVGAGVLDDAFLAKLADIRSLQQRTGLAWDELATWWATRIDARAYEDGKPSLYHRRFIPAGSEPPAAYLPVDARGDAIAGEQSPADPITPEELPTLLAAARLSQADYERLHASSFATDEFTFANFTAIVRAASLARAARLSVAELIAARELVDIDPFASPAHTLEFFAALDTIRRTGFTVAELDWLLRHVGDALVDEAEIARPLVTLARGLATIEAEVAELVDPTGEAVRANLVTVLTDVGDITEAMEIVDGVSELNEAAQQQFIEDEFAGFVDPAVATAQLVTDGGALGDDLAVRRTWVLQVFVSTRRKRTLLVDTAAAAFRVDASVADALLFEVLHEVGGSDALAEVFATSFANEAEIAAGLSPASHTAQFAGWLRLAKAAAFAGRHRITAAQVGWYSGGLSGVWLDLDALPLDDLDADASFLAWTRLVGALELRSLFDAKKLGNDGVGHRELSETSTIEAALDLLAEHTGWDADDLKFIAAEIGWDAPADLDDIVLERLRLIARAGDRLGVALDVLWAWVHEPITTARAAEIRALARAKYGEDRWPNIAQPLRDALREQQRDALIAGILATNEDFSHREQLFEHLLIDVEMSSCMLTTRIVQANASVQMFVHRVLLQLEPQVKFSPGAAHAWTWMKNYRVWEANRRVFLYPENWIEPELRRDKTPQFEELESALMQNTLDDANVERALAGYLAGLDRVGNLEIVSVYAPSPNAHRTHAVWLLGRSQAPPRTWYLRERSRFNRRWQPWQELPLQIDGDNAVVALHRGRVLVFWLMITETGRTQSPSNETIHGVEVAIAWAERDDQGWGQTTMSRRSPMLKADSSTRDPYLLRMAVGERQIVLTAYSSAGAGEARPRAQFRYDYVSRHVEYIGDYFDPEKFPSLLNDDEALIDAGWIGLQPDYRFEGQRFVKVRLNHGAGNDTLAPKFGEDNDFDPHTTFAQGEYDKVLFHRAPDTGYRTLLHQGNFWGRTPGLRFAPVVYDDRQRKFLLEPGDYFESPVGAEDDEVDVDILGPFDVNQYIKCPDHPVEPEIHPSPNVAGAQLVRDRIVQAELWGGQTPGQVHIGIDGFGDQQINVDNAYGGAYQAISGATETTGGAGGGGINSGGFEKVPGAVLLEMTMLYHPYARDLVESVALAGVDAIYRPAESSDLFRQATHGEPVGAQALSLNDEVLIGNEPIDSYDFGFSTAYGVYNWEVFYHIPMLIAGKLRTDQRWAEAQRWLHTIFDPIETVDLPGETTASKFWRIKPFDEQAHALAKNLLQEMLGIGVTPDEQEAAVKKFEDQVAEWRANPFDPHAIARVRPGVYQRALLLSYFDNLIDWADHLFRQDTLESINEATILYVLVSQLLGPRPQEVPGPEGSAKSYVGLVEDGLDAFSNAAQKIENWILIPTEPAESIGCGGIEPVAPWVREKIELRFWYFCYPPNPRLLEYWDIIDDRLWKIRHCRNIEGVERRLAIFQPPIDPGLLVRATAAGVDLASALAELDSGLPPYRFRSVYARADAFCGDLRNLGSALLQAIEKRDAEALARLRAEHELALLAAVRDVRVRQLDEARGAVVSLRRARAAVDERARYYRDLFAAGLNEGEKTAMGLSLAAGITRAASQAVTALGGMLQLIPDLTVSVGTDMSTKTTFGGSYIGGSVASAGEALGIIPTALDTSAGWIATNAQYERRAEDWDFQLGQASLDLHRLDQDIAVAEIRVAIAQRELQNHDLQVEQSRATERFMRDKFSNRELYDWMIDQLSTLYFQTYQLAFDLAKRAERAYRHELAIDGGAPIIKYGYWDSLRKGLLAGEKLAHDLKRLDLAYMDRDVREYELRKNVSLARLDPTALHELQETGTCEFVVPEVLFDLDHPGHVLRRLRSVGLTIPAVTDPYTTLGARLTLLEHRTRRNAAAELELGHGGNDRIATSTATSDAGLFNLDFRDERYLPFEYAGAVSRWKLELPDKVPQFDYRTIADVVVSIAYTARDGGDDFRDSVQAQLEAAFTEEFSGGAAQLFVVHRAFPDEWERFLDPGEEDTEQVLSLPVESKHFPYFVRRKGFEITSVEFILWLDDSITALGDPVDLVFSVGDTQVTLSKSSEGPFAYGTTGTLNPPAEPDTWTLTREQDAAPSEIVEDGWLDRSKIQGLLMVVRYEMS